MKKLVARVCVFVLLFGTIFPIGQVTSLSGILLELVKASDTVVKSGTCGDNVTWTITENADGGYVLTYSGTGVIPEHNIDLSDYSNITLVIEDGITEIGNSVFYDCRKLTGDLTIPNTVTKIGKWAFRGCSGFDGELTLSNRLESIGEEAFYGCENLSGTLVLPDSLKEYSVSSFGFNANCSREDYVISNSLSDYVYYPTYVGDTKQYYAWNNKLIMPFEVTWSSSDENIATVDNNGLVTMVGAGCCTISAECNGEKSTRRIVVDEKLSARVVRGNITWYIPESVKLGFCVSNQVGEAAPPFVAEVSNIDSSLNGKNWFYIAYFGDKDNTGAIGNCFSQWHSSWGPNVDVIGDNSITRVQGALGYAIKPGTEILQLCYYDSGTRKFYGEPYTVTVEEPIITTNEKSQVKVGESLELTSRLDNTELKNEKINDSLQSINREVGDWHKIIYQPCFEVIDGIDCLSISNEDYSMTLSASANIKFVKSGTVKIKIKYVPVNTCLYDYDLGIYSPEKIITIKVNSDKHEYINPVFTWGKDYSSCKVTYICKNHSNEKQTYDCTVTSSKTKATTKKDGIVTYVAKYGRDQTKVSKVYAKKITSATLAKTTVVYTGKSIKPKVTLKLSDGKTLSTKNYSVKYTNNKNIGTATATITLKGNYSGTIKKTFKIIPKTTAISSAKAASKAITVKWKKNSTVSGYQIQVATNKSFTKNCKTYTVSGAENTSNKITELTGNKNYYIRIRCYKTVNGKKYYSSWKTYSKTVKTKK